MLPPVNLADGAPLPRLSASARYSRACMQGVELPLSSCLSRSSMRRRWCERSASSLSVRPPWKFSVLFLEDLELILTNSSMLPRHLQQRISLAECSCAPDPGAPQTGQRCGAGGAGARPGAAHSCEPARESLDHQSGRKAGSVRLRPTFLRKARL